MTRRPGRGILPRMTVTTILIALSVVLVILTFTPMALRMRTLIVSLHERIALLEAQPTSSAPPTPIVGPPALPQTDDLILPLPVVLDVDSADILGPPTDEELRWSGTQDLNSEDLLIVIEHETELIDLDEARNVVLEAMIAEMVDEEIVRPMPKAATTYAMVRPVVRASRA